MRNTTVRFNQGNLRGHAPFPRPATPINRLTAAAFRPLPAGRIRPWDIERWLENSLRVCSVLGGDRDVLKRVRSETAWVVSDDQPPDHDVWSGEVVFSPHGPPAAICYATTPASRLPRSLLELAWQGAMDHFVGHLYPYHLGVVSPREYDETVACRYQHMAAQVRGREDRRYRLIARAIPWVYRAHKGIPLTNYVRLRS